MSRSKPHVAPTPDPRRSQSLEYGVAILKSFTAERPALRISELADMVGISRSTTHRYASTLVALGHLEQDSKRRYRLTRHAAGPGIALIETVRRECPSRAILEELRDKTGHTVSMGLLDGARAVYVHRLHAHGAGQFQADGDLGVGAHVPAHQTAIGKALLSCLLDSELRGLLPYFGSPDGEPEAWPSLTGEIERVRQESIATSDEQRANGVRSIAAPLTRWLDKPILAVGLTVPAGAGTAEELIARFGQPVKHAAKLLSV
jgi:IclR family transcriptional regulator, pca regulon regulatory protein